MNDFNNLPLLKNVNSEKYDGIQQKFKRDDLLPLWVADMDFRCGDFIYDDLKTIIKNNHYSYKMLDDNFYTSIIKWQLRHNNHLVQKDILYSNGVISSIKACIIACSDKDDNILIQTPVYPPFYTSISTLDRNMIENPLIIKDGKWVVNFEDFEDKIKKCKIFLFCNPQNPTGKVFNKKELEKLFSICKKNNTIIISDEIHSDITYDKKHISLASFQEFKDIAITLNAPSKSFNIASFSISYIITKNIHMKKQIRRVLRKYSLNEVNHLGVQALISAYTKGDDWLKEVKVYLKSNIDFAIDNLDKKINIIRPQGTYLLWLDFKNFNYTHKELENILINKCKIVLNNGLSFGVNSSLFFRLNVATSRDVLKEAIKRLEII
jgi:cystathionine beta-lyase